MPIFTTGDRRFAETVIDLSYGNPFLATRIEAERTALGPAFDERYAVWNLVPDQQYNHPNVDRLVDRCQRIVKSCFARLERGEHFAENEEALYVDLWLFVLFHHHRRALDDLMLATAKRRPRAAYRALADEARKFLTIRGELLPAAHDLPHAFACFFQIRRAYKNIFDFIIGISQPAIRLRAVVWESIFTHDMRRYRRLFFRQMGDYTTLITGPSGTGKELIARAVGLSRYIPFDSARGEFAEDFSGSFHAVNLCAFSPTLIESELFGHHRGAFTGAVADRVGWLEECPELGTVFLDEIGEVEPALQVKLLRVLQTREFSRVGETQLREFRGKMIAATNRDLAAEIERGSFRQDLYYRLCSDAITVPTLRERVADTPEELLHLVQHIARRLAGDEAPAVVEETTASIERHLGPNYDWPGNVRELEQCVRNVLVRKEYIPHRPAGAPAHKPAAPVESAATPNDPRGEIAAGMTDGAFTADDLLRRYCTLIYAQCRSYEAAAERLKLDRRTVKAKIDAALLARLDQPRRQA